MEDANRKESGLRARSSGLKEALGDEYLRRIERLEALPRNRSGADKTWVHDALRLAREHFEKAVRR